jgi:predicted secreted protein
MGQPSRRMARDRARRIPFGRADHSQLHKLKVLPETKPVIAAATTAPTLAADSAAAPRRDRTTRIFLICLIAAVAVNFGAMLGLAGSSLLPEVLRAFGLADEPPIEAMQRKQGIAIGQLNATVDALNAAVAGLTARVDFSGEREEKTRDRLADIDAALGNLRTSMNELRTAQGAPGEESWRKPLAELAAAVAKTRTDITGLRASLDEAGRSRQPGEIAAIGARVDRLEQAMALRNLLGPIRGSIQETRSADGHIINLAPAR